MRDDELERELRRAVERFDPVPPHLIRGAIAAFTWRTVDAELAELVFDSLAPGAAAQVRGPDQPRLLTFRAPGVTIELQAGPAPGTGERRIVGQLSPAQPAEITARWADQELATTADDLGRFLLDSPDSGPLRLQCRLPGAATPVVTEWISM